jgi:hypothetical protein
MTTLNNNTNESQIIVAFHIGRGGRFNNSGFRTYLGEKNIAEFVNDLYLNEDETMYLDHNGNEVLSMEDSLSGIGTINIDNDYDTTYTKSIDDCNEHEIELICQSNEHKTIDLVEYLEVVTDYTFDKYGIINQ